MSEPRTNGEIKVPEAPPSAPIPALNVDDVNGRLQELTELNNALMSRCSMLRGQVARLEKELAALRT